MGKVGVLGASSLVGEAVLAKLSAGGAQVFAFSRSVDERVLNDVQWLNLKTCDPSRVEISTWICVAPIWVLLDYLPMLQTFGAKRVVALSSTSVLTKLTSSSVGDVEVAKRLQRAEKSLLSWLESSDTEGVILRPTMIYGHGKDKNTVEIMRFIKRWGFFPLFGKASGLRQPIHVEDVVDACVAVLESKALPRKVYNISGGEVLPYRVMVERLFDSLGVRRLFLHCPLIIFKLMILLLRSFPRYRQWSAAMAERMNQDLVFEHTEASTDFGYSPRLFVLGDEDLPL